MRQTTIAIFTYTRTPPWDEESIQTGIGGSEEAVIYLSREFAQRGFKVLIFGNPPKHSLHTLSYSNPCYVSNSLPISSHFDIAISWRMPHLGKQLRRLARKVYLWPHDILCAPLNSEDIESFDDVLWLSKWQREQWISLSPKFKRYPHIVGNGICPEQFAPICERKNPYSCIYASNYGRGLNILADFWTEIKKEFPQATLDIYYGWNHWGALSASEEVNLKRKMGTLSGIQEHGCVGHKELAEAFGHASFWTYPCTKPETFCITALKAQLAGAIPVVLKGSALHETVQHGYGCTNKEDYLSTLKKALLSAEKIDLKVRRGMGNFILDQFTWGKIAKTIERLFG
jgi:glycosyltransferase involved in cell wall biosynthesis